MIYQHFDKWTEVCLPGYTAGMARDRGVRGDYVDRAFRGYETRTQDIYSRSNPELDARRRRMRYWNKVHSRLVSEGSIYDQVVAARPLKPPGRE